MRYNIKKLLNEQFTIDDLDLSDDDFDTSNTIYSNTTYDKYSNFEIGYSAYYKDGLIFYIDHKDYNQNMGSYDDSIIKPENFIGIVGGIDSNGNVIVFSKLLHEDSYYVAEMKVRLYRVNNTSVKWELPSKTDIIDIMTNYDMLRENSPKSINDMTLCWVRNTNKTEGTIFNIIDSAADTIEFRTVHKNEKYDYFFVTKIEYPNKDFIISKRRESLRKHRCKILNVKEVEKPKEKW